LIKKNSSINQEDIAKELGVSRRTIIRDINALRKKDKIDREGGDFGGKWIVKD
jgi:DeoR/GlpR family transcriptional regulator of sugar metabolism